MTKTKEPFECEGGCGGMVRPYRAAEEDYPGTRAYGASRMCVSCYKAHRRPTTPQPSREELAEKHQHTLSGLESYLAGRAARAAHRRQADRIRREQLAATRMERVAPNGVKTRGRFVLYREQDGTEVTGAEYLQRRMGALR